MSEDRAGQQPDETDLDELLEPEPDEVEPDPDDDLEPEPEPEPEPDGGEPPQKPSRAERRIQTLLKRDKEREAELKELRSAVITRPAQQPAQPQQVDPARQAQLDQQELEYVATLPFEQQGRYWTQKAEQRLQQRMQLSELRTADMLDRREFKQILRERRLPTRYEQEVESLLSQARQNGMNPSREDVLYRVIGQEVLTKKDRETEKQRSRGQRRIASQTTRPTGTRSTAASTGGRRSQGSAADDEALLRGITLGEFENS